MNTELQKACNQAVTDFKLAKHVIALKFAKYRPGDKVRMRRWYNKTEEWVIARAGIEDMGDEWLLGYWTKVKRGRFSWIYEDDIAKKLPKKKRVAK